jgi:hypothetical protein
MSLQFGRLTCHTVDIPGEAGTTATSHLGPSQARSRGEGVEVLSSGLDAGERLRCLFEHHFRDRLINILHGEQPPDPLLIDSTTRSSPRLTVLGWSTSIADPGAMVQAVQR